MAKYGKDNSNYRHGKTRTRIKYCWDNMLRRCYDPKNDKWEYYGGRGIAVCTEWLDFNNFYQDMGDPPKGLTLERKDNDKGYSKENCMWATRGRQGTNRRTSAASGYLGVRRNHNKYMARIRVNKKEHYIGTFATPYLASLAYHACRSVIYPELYRESYGTN